MVTTTTHPVVAAAPPDPRSRFRRLPPRVQPDDMVESQAESGRPDPDAVHDAEVRWMLRYS
jgi:hypothetical protein